MKNILAVDDDGNYIAFKEVVPWADLLLSGRFDLRGKYFIVDNYKLDPVGKKCFRTEGLIEKDIRFFQLPFIIHHNMQIGFVD